MASGKLGAINPSAITLTTLYTAPANTFSVVTINIINTGGSSTTLDISLVDSAASTPALQDYIERNLSLEGSTVYEKTGVVLANGQTLKIYTTSDDLACMAYGIETEV